MSLANGGGATAGNTEETSEILGTPPNDTEIGPIYLLLALRTAKKNNQNLAATGGWIPHKEGLEGRVQQIAR